MEQLMYAVKALLILLMLPIVAIGGTQAYKLLVREATPRIGCQIGIAIFCCGTILNQSYFFVDEELVNHPWAQIGNNMLQCFGAIICLIAFGVDRYERRVRTPPEQE